MKETSPLANGGGGAKENGDAGSKETDHAMADDFEDRLSRRFRALGDSVVARLERHFTDSVAHCGWQGASPERHGIADAETTAGHTELQSAIDSAIRPVLEAQNRIELAVQELSGQLAGQHAGQQHAGQHDSQCLQWIEAPKSVATCQPNDAESLWDPCAGVPSGDLNAIKPVISGDADAIREAALRRALTVDTDANSLSRWDSKGMSWTVSEAVQHQIDTMEQNQVAHSVFVVIRQYVEGFRAWRATMNHNPANPSRCRSFVKGNVFLAMCTAAIMMNGLWAWYATDVQRKVLTTPDPDAEKLLKTAERIFLFFYVFELSLKIAVFRLRFFLNADMTWNIFDTALVLQGIHDEVSAFLRHDEGNSLTFMRLLRLLKLGKVFRVFRALKAVRELRVMFCSVIDSFISMFWCLCLFVLFIYVFSLLIMQGTVQFLQSPEALSMDVEARVSLDKYFGSVGGTMLTLYMATSGGADWEQFYDTIGILGVMYQLVFLVFLVFTTFALLNILTGMLVEKVSTQSADDRDDMLLEWRKTKKHEIDTIKALCHEMDTNGNGLISWDELEEQLQTEGALAFLESLQLKMTDAELFFQVLQRLSDSDEVDIDMFVEGCLRMKGLATGMDQHALAFQMKLVIDRQADTERRLLRAIDRISPATPARRAPPTVPLPSDTRRVHEFAEAHEELATCRRQSGQLRADVVSPQCQKVLL